jgi:hypothetical protein
MATRDVIWCIYPGKHRVNHRDFEDNQLFPVDRCIGVGWPATGNLEPLGCNDAAFYQVVAETHKEHVKEHRPDDPGAWFDRSARILHRFTCEAREGEIVVYACKTRRIVYVGRIKTGGEGKYRFDESTTHWHFRHQRSVEWKNEFRFDDCSKSELAQVRTQSVFWQMKNCPARFIEDI